MKENILKTAAITLRKKGMSYSEIRQTLSPGIPKSTLSGWLKGVPLPAGAEMVLQERARMKLEEARLMAVEVNRNNRSRYLENIRNKNLYLASDIKNPANAKIALAMLYLAEGSKNNGTLILGNSDPNFIRLYLRLLRQCYTIDPLKMRCTVQCRYDQDQEMLKRYWSEQTGIPLAKFYKTLVDHRTLGNPTKRTDYKGVCRITYISAEVFNDIMQSIEIIKGS